MPSDVVLHVEKKNSNTNTHACIPNTVAEKGKTSECFILNENAISCSAKESDTLTYILRTTHKCINGRVS